MPLFELDIDNNYQPIEGSPEEMDIYFELDDNDNIMPRVSGLSLDVPNKEDVLNTATVYDVVSGINVDGVFANAPVNKVENGYQYGAYGIEYTGTLSVTGSDTSSGIKIDTNGLIYEQIGGDNILML